MVLDPVVLSKFTKKTLVIAAVGQRFLAGCKQLSFGIECFFCYDFVNSFRKAGNLITFLLIYG